MDIVGIQNWDEFKKLMGDAHDTFNQKIILWKRRNADLDRYGEDVLPPADATSNIYLKVLLNYNYMRTWPITFTSDTGEMDRQSIQMLINKDYLKSLGYINSNGYFEYNSDHDRFIVDGLVHKASGDTVVSQIPQDDILVSIILKREETPTGKTR